MTDRSTDPLSIHDGVDGAGTEQARLERDHARAVARGQQREARDGGHPNDPLRAKPLPDGGAPMPREAYSGMEHPAVPVPATDQGWDNVVAEADGYRYVQSHWSDALEQAALEQETLAAAASAEVERLHSLIEGLTAERETWLAQREAHSQAADAIHSVRAGVRDRLDHQGAAELAAAEKRAEAGRGMPGRYR